MAEYELVQIEVSKDYKLSDWKADLKRIVKKTGIDGTRVVFLLSDTQLKDENFIEDINMLLNSGDITSLFDSEEKLIVIDRFQTSLEFKQDMSAAELYEKFIERVRSNLHIILAFSPIGNNLRNQLRIFPALINCCMIDWFHEWPDQALESVAHKFLDELDLNDLFKVQAVQMCKLFHQTSIKLSQRYFEEHQRVNYVTPTSYLELIKTFKELLDKKRFEILSLKERYANGAERLLTSEKSIITMQKLLSSLQPKMIKTSIETEDLINGNN